MKITYNWLKEYIDIDISPQELASRLTMLGLEVTSVEKTGSDWVMEIEVTPNRTDCLSIVGVAREAATIEGKKLKPYKSLVSSKFIRNKGKVNVEVRDSRVCTIYVGKIIENVKVHTSPKWLADRLQAAGIRPVNNIVDITNYCQLELGQPLHAFDYDKLEGKEIVVRWAKKGEQILTIDSVERTLDSNILVIADKVRPVAIAGIMGGKSTEVTEQTKNILLESAYFDPVTIRRTSIYLKIKTESSYRFERGVDANAVGTASDRAIVLIHDLASGSYTGKSKTVGKKKISSKSIQLRQSRVNKILGIYISIPKIESLLKRLQFDVTSISGDKLNVCVPSFRRDVSREIDLIEEIIRIYGYDKIPLTMPQTKHEIKGLEEAEPPKPVVWKIKDIVRTTLVSQGLGEILTYSLISRDLLKKANLYDEKEIIPVRNPLSNQQELMRPTLIPGLIDTLVWNINRKNLNLKMFELGHVYTMKNGYPTEKNSVSIGITGTGEENWQSKPSEVNLFNLKGIIEVLLERLGVTGHKVKCGFYPSFSKEKSVVLNINGKDIGYFGGISEEVTRQFDIRENIYVCEIILDEIFPYINLEKEFHEIPKYQPVMRDLAIVIRDDVLSEQIVSVIVKAGKDFVRNVKLFDQYLGKQIPSGFRSLAYSIEYQIKDRNPSAEEINKIHSQICQSLIKDLGAQIR